MDNTYKCAICKTEFGKEWADEEAQTELKENFGDIPVSQCVVVCDDCYNVFMGE